jgi:hypothetical protein
MKNNTINQHFWPIFHGVKAAHHVNNKLFSFYFLYYFVVLSTIIDERNIYKNSNTINTVLLILGTIHDKFQDDVTLCTDIGSDVILKCKVANATRSIWRRENEIISDGLNIKTEQQHRLKIIGDKTLGEYNLQISDLTEDDLGSYSCERTVNNVFIEKQVVIKLTGE